jgi:hypothetical protein
MSCIIKMKVHTHSCLNIWLSESYLINRVIYTISHRPFGKYQIEAIPDREYKKGLK